MCRQGISIDHKTMSTFEVHWTGMFSVYKDWHIEISKEKVLSFQHTAAGSITIVTSRS